eukprot:TRINITY_DN48065_c0_g1_i1.p1 TRINITY_DN48065_c0_g1~~TRINITY_DN48065_c0_g1_i1.p1  ORF type:complete len:204 (+),score=45.35 TRINITY_DN48065_c0_g1_i1:60-614(+)
MPAAEAATETAADRRRRELKYGKYGEGGDGDLDSAREDAQLSGRRESPDAAAAPPDPTGITQKLVAGTAAALDDVQLHVQGAHRAADDTITGLDQQAHTLAAVEEDLDNLRGQLRRARRDLVRVSRGMATNKCIVCFTIVVLLVICIMLGAAIFKQSQGTDETATPPPESVFVPARHAEAAAAP